MTVAVAAFLQQNDTFGEPLAGGKVFTYAAGTLTPLASYTDQTGTVPNTNPVILDSAGRAQIWLTANVPYKLILTDAAGVEQETTDNFYAGASPEQLSIAGIVPSTGGTYTGPVNLNGGAVFGGSAAQDLTTLDSLNIAAVQTSNLWTNPDFAIWQRAASSVADGAYGFDRVVNLCETGSTTLSQLTQPIDGIPYAMRITQPDATPKRVGFAQIVEAKNCLSYRGKNLAFAVRVRCSVAATVRCALVSWTGTQDVPTRDVVNSWTSTSYTAGNFFVASTTTIATAGTAVSAAAWTDLVVSSTSPGGVVVPSSLNNLYMVVWTEGTLAQNATLDASLVRCGQGTVAPLYAPTDVTLELTKCRRYYYRNTTTTQTLLATGLAFSTSAAAFTVPLPQMRVSPALSSTNLFPTNGVGATIAPVSSAVGAGTDSVLVQINVAGGAVAAGQASLLYAGNGAGGFIAFDAEL